MLLLPLAAVAVGLVIGLARRGRLRAIAGTSLRLPALLVGGVVLQAAATIFELPAGLVFIIAAHVALISFCAANWRLAGLTVVSIGLSANLVAIVLNGGMPVRGDALVDAGLATAEEIDAGVTLRGERHVENDRDRLVFLGDIVPLRPTRQVLSFGDLIVLVGLADVAMNLTLRRRDETRPSAGDVMRLDPFVGGDPPEDRVPAVNGAANGTRNGTNGAHAPTNGHAAPTPARAGSSNGAASPSRVASNGGAPSGRTVVARRPQAESGRPPAEPERPTPTPGAPERLARTTDDGPAPKRGWRPRLAGRKGGLGEDEAFWRNVRDDDADRAFWDADDEDDTDRDPRDQTGTNHGARARTTASSGPADQD
ncbi:MAG: DUF5317 family protein [Actinomycetota bacterium]|nr:DUF5317 family protein [Actinomycetota bacterium]